MRQLPAPPRLLYPPSAADHVYYKSSTVAFFLVDELATALAHVLCPPAPTRVAAAGDGAAGGGAAAGEG
jgi:hypothetical protein